MARQSWPALPLAEWRDTCDTLHMWTQIVGKLVLATTPLSNHYWNVAFRLTARGFETQPMTAQGHVFTAAFDLVAHELTFTCSDGRRAAIALRPCTVADFYAEVMETLRAMGLDIPIWTMPVEFADPIAFELDTKHHSYDAKWANAFWRAIASMQPVFDRFRCGFVGKCSPLHFFWGSFDLALTRFSGHRAPRRRRGERCRVLRLRGAGSRGIHRCEGRAGERVLQQGFRRVHPAVRSGAHRRIT